MRPSFPTKPQPEPDNKCPDCLYMKLEGFPVSRESQDDLEFWQTSTQIQQIELHLTLNFSEQWETLQQGCIKFGLKGGELRLKLENGEVPYENRELVGSLELYLYKEQQQQGSGEQKGIKVDSSLNGSQNRDRTSDRFAVTICQVTTKVSEENPVWIFEEESGKPVLKGLLDRTKLATINVMALPCRIEATFEVSQRDVCLTDARELWPPDISRNKRAVLDRLIIQHLLEAKFQPYLSRAELYYD